MEENTPKKLSTATKTTVAATLATAIVGGGIYVYNTVDASSQTTISEATINSPAQVTTQAAPSPTATVVIMGPTPHISPTAIPTAIESDATGEATSPSIEEANGTPLTLAIDSVGLTMPIVEAPVVSTGVSNQVKMEIPDDSFVVGHLSSSMPLTSSDGTTTLAAHVNTAGHLEDAPMALIKKTHVGDVVTTTDANGTITKWSL